MLQTIEALEIKFYFPTSRNFFQLFSLKPSLVKWDPRGNIKILRVIWGWNEQTIKGIPSGPQLWQRFHRIHITNPFPSPERISELTRNSGEFSYINHRHPELLLNWSILLYIFTRNWSFDTTIFVISFFLINWFWFSWVFEFIREIFWFMIYETLHKEHKGSSIKMGVMLREGKKINSRG